MSHVAPPALPGAVAELTITVGTRARTLVLSQHQRWDDAVLDGPVSDMLDEVSTALLPRVRRGEGIVLWLHGLSLGELNAPADTVEQTSLLLELAPGLQPGVFKAALWLDRGEVPRDLYEGVGEVRRGTARQVIAVDLTLQHSDYGDDVGVTGLIRAV